MPLAWRPRLQGSVRDICSTRPAVHLLPGRVVTGAGTSLISDFSEDGFCFLPISKGPGFLPNPLTSPRCPLRTAQGAKE